MQDSNSFPGCTAVCPQLNPSVHPLSYPPNPWDSSSSEKPENRAQCQGRIEPPVPKSEMKQIWACGRSFTCAEWKHQSFSILVNLLVAQHWQSMKCLPKLCWFVKGGREANPRRRILCHGKERKAVLYFCKQSVLTALNERQFFLEVQILGAQLTKFSVQFITAVSQAELLYMWNENDWSGTNVDPSSLFEAVLVISLLRSYSAETKSVSSESLFALESLWLLHAPVRTVGCFSYCVTITALPCNQKNQKWNAAQS